MEANDGEDKFNILLAMCQVLFIIFHALSLSFTQLYRNICVMCPRKKKNFFHLIFLSFSISHDGMAATHLDRFVYRFTDARILLL